MKHYSAFVAILLATIVILSLFILAQLLKRNSAYWDESEFELSRTEPRWNMKNLQSIIERHRSRRAIRCFVTGYCMTTGGDSNTTAPGTCCSGCHSCTYNNCCHCIYTNPYTPCSIPGYRSPEYKGNLTRRFGHCG
ncbi:hypothetical protein Ddc_13370 [Ditylenchus destructor]|nr:hypothetical protein Ddc_13370 [Ditylenchus destructor]